MDIENTIDRALEELQRIALARREATEEWTASLLKFGGGVAPQAGDPIVRRHREWFLLERPSVALSDVPVHALAGEFESLEDLAIRDVLAWLIDTRVGVFEVRDVEPGNGLWLHDLLGLGALPVREPRASAALADGDLVVGRVYGIGDGQFVLSSAMSVFRSAGLVEALRSDVERLRAGRRGSLRITQEELEAMFFVPVEGEDPDAAKARAIERLKEAGWDDEDCADLATILESADRAEPGAGEVELASTAIAAVLERAAFESSADLDALRRELAQWWAALRARSSTRAAPNSVQIARDAEKAASRTETARAADARAALAAFDEGRTKGRDLDALFNQLEADLGINAGDDAEDPGPALDFPGVIGAMVEEYLWEREREESGSTVSHATYLRALGSAEQGLGLFEELDESRLLSFATRTAIELDLCGVDSTRGAGELLGALRDFAQWADREHDLGLWIAFERMWSELSESLPRAASIARTLVRPVGLDWAPRTWARVDADGRHASRGQEQFEIKVATTTEPVREGDWLVGRVHGGEFRVAAVLPPAAGRLRDEPSR